MELNYETFYAALVLCAIGDENTRKELINTEVAAMYVLKDSLKELGKDKKAINELTVNVANGLKFLDEKSQQFIQEALNSLEDIPQGE